MIDNTTYEPLAEYNKFWPRGFIPMFINVSGSMSRIYGYSLSKQGGILTILNNFIEPKNTTTDYLRIPPDETWAGMEQSTAGEYIIVSVQSKVPNQPQYLKMIAYNASRTKLSAVAKKTFNSSQFTTVQFMRKVKGYDYYVVACRKFFGIFFFSGGDFFFLNFFENLYRELIFEVVIHGDYMIPVSTGKDEPIKIIEFNKTSYNSLVENDKFKQNSVMNNKANLMNGVFGSQKVKKLDVPHQSNFLE